MKYFGRFSEDSVKLLGRVSLASELFGFNGEFGVILRSFSAFIPVENST